jgi:hypothetical protein
MIRSRSEQRRAEARRDIARISDDIGRWKLLPHVSNRPATVVLRPVLCCGGKSRQVWRIRCSDTSVAVG